MTMQSAKSQFHSANDMHLIVQEACIALASEGVEAAKQIINTKYPFEPIPKGYCREAKPIKITDRSDDIGNKRKAEYKDLDVYQKDGFTDRYTGHKLVYPEVLKLLTEKMPREFPVLGNWKLAGTHFAYYDLWPSIDHVNPVARGGSNELDNLVTTSWRNNLIKSNHKLDEIGEQLLPPGDLKEWDGLLGWYDKYLNSK